MPACHTSRRSARPFVITPYVEGGDGKLVPLVPDEGPCRMSDGGPCRLWVDHYRARKTGPEFPLAVLRCGHHGRGAFTVYPPGYVPYGRHRIAPVAADGSGVHSESKDRIEPFAATVFAAAIDAAAGRAWSREGRGPWWSGQTRWLARLLSWMGVAADLEAQVRARLAAILQVAQLVLLEQARSIAASRGYRQRGRAVVMVLARLRYDASLADRLVAAGSEVGLWAQALRWHADSAQLRPVGLPSPPSRTAPSG